MNYDKIMEEIRAFCEDRDWRQFHNPKDLASALSIEVSELQEIYLWKNPAEVDDVSQKKRDQIEQEIADIAIYLLDLVDVLDIDLEKVIQEKLEQNQKKYPVEDAKGKNLKYDEL